MQDVISLLKFLKNKAEYTATLVACGWAGAVLERVTRASGQEQYAQKAQKHRKSKEGTNRPTDGPIKRGVESRSTRLIKPFFRQLHFFFL